jgi:drug/metabolite transporter (DMT)-like permease
VFHPAVLLLLITALTNALYQILTRKLVDESAHTTLFYSALVGTVALSLALPWALATACCHGRTVPCYCSWGCVPGSATGR